ncbi:MAG: methyltransferase domain-containing protein [Lachnospira sp.]|nr:methyltransferase domain-containing protein [Lachnospira sp.]
MNQYDDAWDKLLRIKTTGRDDSRADQYNYPYEPTSYAVLERLAGSGFIKKNDVLLDYGCGKGRVDFFIAYQTKAKVIGIEYDERIYEKAIANKNESVSSAKVQLVLTKAETYDVPKEVNKCYFFNPFSVEIFGKVMSRIIDSYYTNPRPITLFFYYPSSEYIAYLMSVNELDFIDEIDCHDISDGESAREKILIFSMGYGL